MSVDTRLDPVDEVRHRYDFIAPAYDLFESLMEVRATRWRREIWQRVIGPRVLEIGIGTGKNVRFHPTGARVVGIDISPRMLERARRRVARYSASTELLVADAQQLPFASASFDTVVSTFVFCSVPDPAAALAEARRVLVPGGQLLLLEHVLSERPLLRRLMRWLDPIPARLWGAHLDRETGRTVRDAGFEVLDETALSIDVVRRIEARAPVIDPA